MAKVPMLHDCSRWGRVDEELRQAPSLCISALMSRYEVTHHAQYRARLRGGFEGCREAHRWAVRCDAALGVSVSTIIVSTRAAKEGGTLAWR